MRAPVACSRRLRTIRGPGLPAAPLCRGLPRSRGSLAPEGVNMPGGADSPLEPLQQPPVTLVAAATGPCSPGAA